MSTDDANPRPDELEDRLDDLMAGGAEAPEGGGAAVSTNPDETEAEHDSMAIADSDHEQDPGRDAGGGG